MSRWLTRTLREAGFRKAWDSRAGGVRTIEWRREEADGRTLHARINEDGRHSVSHSWLGCADTLPTPFEGAHGLDAAIAREAVRMDGRYADPDNHHAPGARDLLRAKQASAKAQP